MWDIPIHLKFYFWINFLKLWQIFRTLLKLHTLVDISKYLKTNSDLNLKPEGDFDGETWHPETKQIYEGKLERFITLILRGKYTSPSLYYVRDSYYTFHVEPYLLKVTLQES